MKESKPNISTDWSDPDDAPELTDEFFAQADEYVGDQLIRRGRPLGSGSKEQITIRLDVDVLDAFRTSGAGWQTRMNNAMRDWLQSHPQVQ